MADVAAACADIRSVHSAIAITVIELIRDMTSALLGG
jgi:hypothetical protein